MTSPTTPDSIVRWTLSDPVSLVQESQAQGDSIQAAFSKRERYDFVWANSTERTTQTGMTQGSRGYQVDIKTEYIYDNSAWRLLLSHAEFTASASVANATLDLIGTPSLDATKSTNSTFVTVGGDGNLVIVDPGVYAVSTVTTLTAAATGRSFMDLAFVASAGDIQRMSIVVGEDRGSLAAPNVRTTAANQDIYFQVFQTTGGTRTVGTRIRITRMG